MEDVWSIGTDAWLNSPCDCLGILCRPHAAHGVPGLPDMNCQYRRYIRTRLILLYHDAIQAQINILLVEDWRTYKKEKKNPPGQLKTNKKMPPFALVVLPMLPRSTAHQSSMSLRRWNGLNARTPYLQSYSQSVARCHVLEVKFS